MNHKSDPSVMRDKPVDEGFAGPRWPLLVQTLLPLTRGWWVGTGFLRQRYGDLVKLRIADFGSKDSGAKLARDGLVLLDPEHMREVFGGSPEVYRAGEGVLIRPVVGEHSVLSVDGDVHARIRKLLTPSFTAAALRGYAGMFEELAEADVAQWPVGRVVRSHEHTQRLTLDVILRTVFGVSDAERSALLRPLLARILRPVLLDGVWLFRPGLAKIGIGRGYQRELIRLNRLMDLEVAERRKDAGLRERTDVLSRMVVANVDGDRLSDDELRDQLISLVIAGYETTAKALAWCLLDLAHNPVAQRAAQDAADTGDVEHLTAVFKESLRLHPVVAFTVRRLSTSVQIADKSVPKGWSLLPWISAPHFDARYFPEPEVFRPGRFLGEAQRASARYWQPFGGGARRCIGASFSLLEASVILRSVLTRYTIEPGEHAMERPSRQFTVVIGPRNGGRVRFVPRKTNRTVARPETGDLAVPGECPVQH